MSSVALDPCPALEDGRDYFAPHRPLTVLGPSRSDNASPSNITRFTPARETRFPSTASRAPDHAFWAAPAHSAASLQFLGWGLRNFSEHAPAVRQSDEWVYAVIESGAPTLVMKGRSEQISAPALVLIGPGRPFTWRDDPAQTTKMLEWRWRRPIHPAIAQAQADAVKHFTLAPSELAELRQLHAFTRAEVHRGDSCSDTALMGLHALLEALVVRISECSACDPRKEIVARAVRWIEAHLATRQPLARLADFLGVSPATVRRLFREQFGSTVMKTIAELRRREAERMLAGKEVTVKEVAYHLGYRHPHDFSRAFRKYTGKLPSRLDAACATSTGA
ncbi:helix-turn-helix domain-containing protein [Horticoccus luteus]|uniref:Helix-turn-helix domain-containing protein n=1 Tax=Horticoccus luteus TaxID=2862869 RepID=A0A8F9TVH3_9BACT|nr:AraC family transcriptional regulator [Horticoccus luteus]QYM78528.1 helix-turn-helix domain-containing protein [Horticoccus luteus]